MSSMPTPATCSDCHRAFLATTDPFTGLLFCSECTHEREEQEECPETSPYSCMVCKLYWRDCARCQDCTVCSKSRYFCCCSSFSPPDSKEATSLGCPDVRPHAVSSAATPFTTPAKASSAPTTTVCPGAPKPAERLSSNETRRCISPIPMHPLSEVHPPPAARDALHRKRKITSVDSSGEEEEEKEQEATQAKRQKAYGVGHLQGGCSLCKLIPENKQPGPYDTCIHRYFESSVSFDYQAYVHRTQLDECMLWSADASKCQFIKLLGRSVDQVAADERKVRWHRYLAHIAMGTHRAPCLEHKVGCSCDASQFCMLLSLRWDHAGPSPPADFE